MSSIDVAPEIPAYVPAQAVPPPPVLDSPPPTKSGGVRTAMRVVLVVIAALVTLGALGSLGALAFGLSGSRVITDSQELPVGMRMLTMDTGDVPVALRVVTDVDADEPRIDLRVLTSTDDTQLTIANDDASSRVTLWRQRFRVVQIQRHRRDHGCSPARCRTRIDGDGQPAGRLAIHRRRPRSAGCQDRRWRRHTRRLRSSSRCRRRPR